MPCVRFSTCLESAVPGLVAVFMIYMWPGSAFELHQTALPGALPAAGTLALQPPTTLDAGTASCTRQRHELVCWRNARTSCNAAGCKLPCLRIPSGSAPVRVPACAAHLASCAVEQGAPSDHQKCAVARKLTQLKQTATAAALGACTRCGTGQPLRVLSRQRLMQADLSACQILLTTAKRAFH
jgi:hypothetical protein